MPLALRLSGQLLLGVVRIYARKLEFLHRDSDDALVKIRQARACCCAASLASPSFLGPQTQWCTLAGLRRRSAARPST